MPKKPDCQIIHISKKKNHLSCVKTIFKSVNLEWSIQRVQFLMIICHIAQTLLFKTAKEELIYFVWSHNQYWISFVALFNWPKFKTEHSHVQWKDLLQCIKNGTSQPGRYFFSRHFNAYIQYKSKWTWQYIGLIKMTKFTN